MEIATETNKVLDKLAEILGATGSEVVDAYTEGMFYAGVKDAALSLIFCCHDYSQHKDWNKRHFDSCER